MFHRTRSGGRGICRAIVRTCPLGGEPAFLAAAGIIGPARPSPSEARAAGAYDAIYGGEKTRQERIKERRLERQAVRAALAGTSAATANVTDNVTNDYSPEYAEKLASVKKLISEFDGKYDGYLDRSSGAYFVATQKNSVSDENYLTDLNNVGENVTALADLRMKDNHQAREDREAFLVERKAVQDAKDEFDKKDDEKRAEISAAFNAGKINRMVALRNQKANAASYDRTMANFRMKIKDVEVRYGVKYEATYGKAYKESLADLGVEFADGDVMFTEKVSNANNVSDSFAADMKSSISYYPNEWVDNIDSNLNVHEYTPRNGTMGYISRYEGRHYTESGKKVNLYSSNHATTVHEFGHVLEINNPTIGRAERLFLIQEKKNSGLKKVIKYDSQKNLATNTLVRDYSGVYYTGGSARNDNHDGSTYEVFTTGVENLFCGDVGGFTTGDDCKAPQHRNFILGLFATKAGK